jgi:hypothetical protein
MQVCAALGETGRREAMSEAHNAAMLPLLQLVTSHADGEAAQWVILESLCLGIGKLHHRTPRQTAEFIEAMAERLTTGART